MPDVEQELDRLYGLPLGEFTAARNDLAKRLRKAGDRDGAERVATLRKPSVTAWAINQTARRSPEQVESLIDAGRELFEAQKAALGGQAAGRFEAAQKQQRDAVHAVVRTGRAILDETGHAAGDQAADRIASTLRAASVDEAGQQLLEQGRFDDDFQGGGMLLLAGFAPSSPRRSRPSQDKAMAAAEPPPGRRRPELAEARAALRDARAAERDARRNADRAEKTAGRARKEADQALAAARGEEQRASALRAEAASAAEAVDEAQRRLRELQ